MKNKSTKLPMVIRQASLVDLQHIAALHAKSWQENYHTVLSAQYLEELVHNERLELWTKRLTAPKDNQCVLVIEVEGNFSGFICVYGGNHLEYGSIIDNLHIVSKIKGQGLGSALIKAATEWLATNYSTQGIYLEVLECNTNAIGFYQSLSGENIDTAYWRTPCGNKAKEFIYRWKTPERLISNLATK